MIYKLFFHPTDIELPKFIKKADSSMVDGN